MGQASYSPREKVEKLFQYLAELSKMQIKNITDFDSTRGYQWKLLLKDIPESPEYISLSYKDSAEPDVSGTILSVRKPDLPGCPAPDECLTSWLRRDYDNPSYRGDLKIEKKPKTEPSGTVAQEDGAGTTIAKADSEEYYDHFDDSEERTEAFKKWSGKRSVWVERYDSLKKVQDFFIALYKEYNFLEQYSDSVELVVANGFIFDKTDSNCHHPVLTRKVKLEFLQHEDTIRISDMDCPTELYENFIYGLKEIFTNGLHERREELKEKEIHPLNREMAEDYLKRLVAAICPDNHFVTQSEFASYGSESQAFAAFHNRLLCYMNPVFYVRKKDDGIERAIAAVLDDIEHDGEIPDHLKELVSGEECSRAVQDGDEYRERSIEESLAAVGGEDSVILLSKEANSEQLAIAQRIAKYNAVLVQGPPGTGKTHTIANLLGHFLAQGKKVLVTSRTKKALAVLKEKVVPGIQNLCVSVLDDSREDMERSIDGITDYMSRHSSAELEKGIERDGAERNDVIKTLADTRKRIFRLIHQECGAIDIGGELLSPTQAATFVADHADTLSFIPGEVKSGPLPLTHDELRELYSSNTGISKQEEQEFACALPALEDIPSPDEFDDTIRKAQDARERIKAFEDENACKIDKISGTAHISFSRGDNERIVLGNVDETSLNAIKAACSALTEMKPWQIAAAVDGAGGGALGERWKTLIPQIGVANEKYESYIGATLGKNVNVGDERNFEELKAIVDRMSRIFADKGRISVITRLFNKDFDRVLKGTNINGNPVKSAEDLELLALYLEYRIEYGKCGSYWHELIASQGGIGELETISETHQIKAAAALVPEIEASLAWRASRLDPLKEAHCSIGLRLSNFFNEPSYFSRTCIESAIESAPLINSTAGAMLAALELAETEKLFEKTKATLDANSRISSCICQKLLQSVEAEDAGAYRKAYEDLRHVLNKNSVLRRRLEFLSRLDDAAPDWADAIRNRIGIHGETSVPARISDAWKWAQCRKEILRIVGESFDDLQRKSSLLSKKYREITAEYASKKAWLHLLLETESNIGLSQALHSWKLLAKKIGKGTGKNAPRYRAEARKQMEICQSAVPAWIMPMGKVFESFSPGRNIFDIVIVDEASQASILALPLVYMGKKVVIVGDDKQVSPMAIGTDLEQSNNMLDTHLKGVIANHSIYDLKCSIYDIAETTFQPLMLREHFRCVPEIIGFSNGLSYDFNIKPMRDGSDNKLLPAVISYHVDGGVRCGKCNMQEAMHIVALLKACLQQDEYSGKTFGIISLLGQDQVKTIQDVLCKYIDLRDLESHSVLCGDASNFQGDERDVVFISLVDSPNDSGPIRLAGEGSDDSTKKRYNVAASRAKNQMWVVHSLDAANDLKPGDMRKRLIDYAEDPSVSARQIREIERKSESPFEEMVAKSLSASGYRLTMQYKVGSYRLDMVAQYKNQRVAIECDGERFHSGSDKIREDMERQTILERIGWRFIRVRGSEYFSNPSAAINRIIRELGEFGVQPEDDASHAEDIPTTELYDRVRSTATRFLEEWETSSEKADLQTIQAALRHSDQFPDVPFSR